MSPHSYQRTEVVQIINSVLGKVGQTETVSRDSIFHELEDLLRIIEDTRRDIGPAVDINAKHIPTATDELDAVVEATAEATGSIMDCCDVISEQAAALGGDAEEALTTEVTKIYEACSFQDITGQRITKVVSALKEIEAKVKHIEEMMGVLPSKSTSGDEEGDSQGSGEESLLNGPQLPGNAITQDDIDKLLAEFD